MTEKDFKIDKLKDGTLIEDVKQYLEKKYEFIPTSTATATKASNGPFNGEFERFITRIETKLNDRRLDFIINPKMIIYNYLLD